MSVAMTRAPAAANARAVARPMPWPAAVTKAVLPSRRPDMRTCSLAEGAADAAPVLDSMLLPGWDGEDRRGEAGFGERRDALLQFASGPMSMRFVSHPM